MLRLYRQLSQSLTWLLMPFMMSASLAVPVEENLEYSVKGAYLYKFGSFVEWPPAVFPSADAPLIIGVLGDDPFGVVLDQIILGRSINGRPLMVRRVRSGEQIKDIHILFISKSERQHVESIVTDLQGVLTIGEFEAFPPGVMINFALESNKVRFDVDLEPANRAGIKMSSKLLSVARTVKGKNQ